MGKRAAQSAGMLDGVPGVIEAFPEHASLTAQVVAMHRDRGDGGASQRGWCSENAG
jgi:hypothetical protein